MPALHHPARGFSRVRGGYHRQPITTLTLHPLLVACTRLNSVMYFGLKKRPICLSSYESIYLQPSQNTVNQNNTKSTIKLVYVSYMFLFFIYITPFFISLIFIRKRVNIRKHFLCKIRNLFGRDKIIRIVIINFLMNYPCQLPYRIQC